MSIIRDIIQYLASLVQKDKRVPLSGPNGLNPTWIDRTQDVILETVSVSNTTEETTILTEPIAKSTLYKGQLIFVYATGQFSTANSSAQVTLRVRMGNTIVASIVNNAKSTTDAPWYLKYMGTVRAVNGDGYISSYINTHIDDQFQHTNHPNQNFDTDLLQDITITVQWNEADAGNIIEIDQGVMYFMGKEQQ
jgi:hypothetical protein